MRTDGYKLYCEIKFNDININTDEITEIETITFDAIEEQDNGHINWKSVDGIEISDVEIDFIYFIKNKCKNFGTVSDSIINTEVRFYIKDEDLNPLAVAEMSTDRTEMSCNLKDLSNQIKLFDSSYFDLNNSNPEDNFSNLVRTKHNYYIKTDTILSNILNSYVFVPGKYVTYGTVDLSALTSVDALSFESAIQNLTASFIPLRTDNNNIELENIADIKGTREYTPSEKLHYQRIYFKFQDPLEADLSVSSSFNLIQIIFENTDNKFHFKQNIESYSESNLLQSTNAGNSSKSNYFSYDDLITTVNKDTLENYYNINNVRNVFIEQKVNVDFSIFSNFIKYGSAQEYVNLFYKKKLNLDDYTTQLNSTGSIAGFLSQKVIDEIKSNINKIYASFTGFEKYLYYSAESDSSTEYFCNSFPRDINGNLYSITSNEGNAWYTESIEIARQYDYVNQDRLVYNISEMMIVDSENEDFIKFIEMLGICLDNIYIHIKYMPTLYQFDNRLNVGTYRNNVMDLLNVFGFKITKNNLLNRDFTLSDILIAQTFDIEENLNTRIS